MSTLPKTRSLLRVPKWVPVLYGLSAVAMAPWIIHLQNTLPPQQPLSRWVATWVGFDIIMLSLILLIVALAIKKSLWLSTALIALAALLFADAWFDVMTANGSREAMFASGLALFAELPWAVISLGLGLWLNRQLITRSKK